MRDSLLLTAPETGHGGGDGSSPAQATRKRLLVVDDDAMVLSALRRVLDILDVDVETCSDPVRAVEKLAHEAFDLVISDERMPKMSGLDVLGRVRRDSPRTPTILLTAYGSAEAQERAYERCGVYRLMTKPWDNRDLLSTVREALRAASRLA
jgi:DNA-binding NtrC family response regulator